MGVSKFRQMRHPFSMECAVEVTIRAPPTVVWTILTDAAAFPHWNSTVTRIEGEIREGARLQLHVPGTSRTFAMTSASPAGSCPCSNVPAGLRSGVPSLRQ
jgi:hypothetical protein